jgi:hypothetical protein
MSSSALDPSGPAQPAKADAYKARDNPVGKEPYERAQGDYNRASINEYGTDQRIPREQSSSVDDATPSSLAYGVRGAPPGEEAKGYTEQDVGRHQELDAQQMAAPGEGDVYQAVEGRGGKSGASGNEPGMEENLERKKREQASDREAIKERRRRNIDVGGVLGQSSGPANPIEKGNYPNSGDY